jgi:predicted dehydrogenase
MVKVRDECLKYGPITHGVCEMHKNEMIPYLGARGNMMNDCVHSVDTIRWICGGEVSEVQSHCKRLATPDISWISATVQFDNGSTGFIISNWCTGRRVWRMQMHAPGVCTDIEIEGKARLYADGDYEGVEYDTKEVAGSEDLFIYAGYQSKHREFVDSLLQGKEVTSSPFRDALKTMELAEKILAQAALKGE